MTLHKLIALIVVVGLALGGWYYASPWLAMKGIRDAAMSADAQELQSRIDFQASRASAAPQVDEAIDAQTGDGRLLDRLEGRVARELAGLAVDQALTPRGMAALISTGALAAPLVPKRLRGQKIEWSVERDGLNHFRGVGRFQDGSAGPVLHFERDGLGWTMVGVDLPQWGVRL